MLAAAVPRVHRILAGHLPEGEIQGASLLAAANRARGSWLGGASCCEDRRPAAAPGEQCPGQLPGSGHHSQRVEGHDRHNSGRLAVWRDISGRQFPPAHGRVGARRAADPGEIESGQARRHQARPHVHRKVLQVVGMSSCEVCRCSKNHSSSTGFQQMSGGTTCAEFITIG